jgi:predicted small secreted protein
VMKGVFFSFLASETVAIDTACNKLRGSDVQVLGWNIYVRATAIS